MSSGIFKQDTYFLTERAEFQGDRDDLGAILIFFQDQAFPEIDQSGQLNRISRSPPIPLRDPRIYDRVHVAASFVCVLLPLLHYEAIVRL